jgi:hypothetical protein
MNRQTSKLAGLLLAGAGCAAGAGFAVIADASARLARLSSSAEERAFQAVAKGTLWAASARGSNRKEPE